MGDLVGRGERVAGGEVGPLGVEEEVVEVDVTPAAGNAVDEANLDTLALVFGQVDDDTAHRLGVLAAGLGKDDV